MDDEPKFDILPSDPELFEKMEKRTKMMYLICLVTCLAVSTSSQILGEDWKPVQRQQSLTVSYHGNAFAHQPQFLDDRYSKINQLGSYEPTLLGGYHSDSGGSSISVPKQDGCGLYKVGFSQDLYFQYVQYKANMPDLKEFTLCTWTKFHNHSNDHPIFSYAVGDQPRAIVSWVSNTDRASYYSMSVAGHTFYRLNYPLRLNRWYHSCQSWNGRTGEWQIWVNGERVGRGFHNRLVGHVIKGGGVAITGQEQSQVGGGFSDGKNAQKGVGGMQGEFTMLQLYHVALTAGKAHKDHKHHHVHHFGHDGSPLSLTTAPPPPSTPTPQENSLLVGGQLTPMLELNLGNGPQVVPAQLPNGLQLNQQYVNGQFSPGRAISEQLYNTQTVQQLSPAPTVSQYQSSSPFGGPSGTRLLLTGQLAHPANVQFFEGPFGGHSLFKRRTGDDHETKRSKRDNPELDPLLAESEVSSESKKQSKRGLVALSDGSIVDDSILGQESFEQSLLNGLAGLGENIPVQNIQKEKVDEREPAEAEVRAVMEVCNGCAEEPFQKALILGWKTTPKKLFSGAYYTAAVPACKAF
ncbi:pentraxin-related protein b6 isoform X3 [Arctopsyche grandis]|uniref:pentraxin-related protein b6 isoform X3 n=2 Tax=Arctopsyche grandis TaxID=121162 RepID=UPI00406D96FE